MEPNQTVKKAGGVILSKNDPSKLLLIYRASLKDWSLPKGHVDPGETAEEAAVREAAEETGLRVAIEKELAPLEYATPNGKMAAVRMFLMRSEDDSTLKPEHPGDQVVWLSPAEASERVSYDNLKEWLAGWIWVGVGFSNGRFYVKNITMNKPNLTKPTCAIIPGFGEKASDQAYRKTRRLLEKFGWRVMPIDINWSRTTMTGWLKQAEDKLKDAKNTEAIFGFSFGAMMALLLAARHPHKTIIAASPSPYFKEILPSLPPIAEKVLGKKRMQDFKKFSINETKKIKGTRVHVLVGGADFPPLIKMTKHLQKLVPTSTLSVIPEVPHDLGDERYLRALETTLKRVKK